MKKNKYIDLDSLSEEQFQEVESTLRARIRNIVDAATLDINSLLSIYGLESVLSIEILKHNDPNLIRRNHLKVKK
jgi:hypothetical protein